MSARTKIINKVTSTQGGTVARVLLIILGALQIMFGVILLIASIAIAVDGDPSILILLPFALATIAGGVIIIVFQARLGQDASANPSAGTSAKTAPGAPAEDTDAEHIVSSVPLSNAREGDTSARAPEPAGTATSDASAASKGQTEDVAHLVFRSEDLFATMRDLVRHESFDGSDKRHLATMLDAAGVMQWTDAPACEGGRLSRNTHFWVRMSADDLTDEQYDTMVTAEAALSVNQDLSEVRHLALNDPQAKAAALNLLRAMGDQVILSADLTAEGLRAAYQDEKIDRNQSEWVLRSAICNAAECVRTPFRVVFDLRADVSASTALIELQIPRPRCMAIFTDDPQQQVDLARAYALRLAVLLAQNAFVASDALETVYVNCRERGSESTLLSLNLNRVLADKLQTVARTERIEGAFPTDAAIRAEFSGGWFAPVEPFVALDGPSAITPEVARIYPELDKRTASPAIQRTCGAKRICDLGINENAARIDAWNKVRPQLGTTTEQAVSALVAARDSAEDITVAEACNRCTQALVEGSADLDNIDQLADLFVDGSALDRAVAKAIALLDDENGHEDPEKAAQLLEQALAPIEDMGIYLDDETYVYRYFGSVSERVHHNLAVDEGGREIRLVPDAYFNAHSNASIAFGMLGQTEQAMAHADICLRLAPTSTYATMRKVRLLESQSRIYEAADLIKGALRHAVTPRDAAVCHYRLAYMEWKLGREDLAVACYQRSLSWDTEMRSQAREELDDLLSSNSNLSRLSDEQADALLAREGIPLGCVRSDGDHTLGAAVACMDDKAFFSARPLVAAVYGMSNDDVVMGVYRSLNVSV